MPLLRSTFGEIERFHLQYRAARGSCASFDRSSTGVANFPPHHWVGYHGTRTRLLRSLSGGIDDLDAYSRSFPSLVTDGVHLLVYSAFAWILG
ncbi:hypothetical protein CYMTET_55764 [Cymbomonas tetramitiformis]|uniref:Uncharacterized protein n=1 Tax=Cymbomonas tetramitiformis TaxID=36881 RepID=A0AAE0EMH3_9CHLO|nr:hypothetical protein CYMTET_55764 [Cymbomonas tetramitiformis]